MSTYQNLLWPDAAPVTQGKKSAKVHMRGCQYCPQNGYDGIHKIKGTVEGKKVFVWAQSPGPTENELGEELKGKAGKWFWEEMKKVGITRDMCDIQNVMRCYPATWEHDRLVMRNPTKEELFCCSLYTDQAIVASRAKVHIVLGRVAAQQLFGKKNVYGVGKNIFWSDKLNGKVVVIGHPAYFIRPFADEAKLDTFREGLKAAARMMKEKAGKFSFLEEQDYEGITDYGRAREVAKEIRKAAAKGIRVSVDIEDDFIGDSKRRSILCIGFCWRPGKSRVFCIDHPTAPISDYNRKKIRKVVRGLIEDPSIRKACHSGSHDKTGLKEIEDWDLKRYDFDTRYSEYFRWPGRRSYALAAIVEVRFPDFVGFKEVVMPEAAPKGMPFDRALKNGKLRFSQLPWKKIVMRCGADADITKRIELDTKEHISLPLLRVYRDAAFTLDIMKGPWFDYRQCELLGKIYPSRISKQRQELELIANEPDFNPNNPADIARILYGKLKIKPINKKADTTKNTLEILSPQHEFCKKVIKYRADCKLDSTYRVGFKNCADAHDGRLFTKWWLTGTKTGRLSSGGSREGEEFITVNLQNIHGDPQVQNMLVSDPNWRDIYQAWKDAGDDKSWWKEFVERVIYLMLDYSQNELRFFAQSSGDEALIEQFNSGEDIHCLVGNEITGWDIEVIRNNKKKRKLIKNFHFGLLYGLTEEGMLTYLKVNGVKTTPERVHSMMTRYFKKYRRVKEFIHKMHKMAEDLGYVENILGFRCPIQVTEERTSGAFWANQAVNTPIQGGAHQLLLMGLAALKRKPKSYKLIKAPNMEVHDALINSLKVKNLEEGTRKAMYLLEHEVLNILQDDFGLKWKIPLVAEAKVGFRFGVPVDYKPGQPLGDVMNSWCEANRKSIISLQKELRTIQEAVPV